MSRRAGKRSQDASTSAGARSRAKRSTPCSTRRMSAQGSRVLDVGTGAGDAARYAVAARRGGDGRRRCGRNGGDRCPAEPEGDLRPGGGDRPSVRRRLLRRGCRQQRHPAHRRARPSGLRAKTDLGSRRSHRIVELGCSGALALLRRRAGSRRERRGAGADTRRPPVPRSSSSRTMWCSARCWRTPASRPSPSTLSRLRFLLPRRTS